MSEAHSNPIYGMSVGMVEPGIWAWLVFDGTDSWGGEAQTEQEAYQEMIDSFSGQFGPELDPHFAISAWDRRNLECFRGT